MLCDSQGHPLRVTLSGGQAHESQYLEELLYPDSDDASNPVDAIKPKKLAGDKAYRADWIDLMLLADDITPVIPSKANEDTDARPVSFDKEAYKCRSIVEQLIGWLKEYRRIATRFEKTATNFLAMVKLGFIDRYLRITTS